MNRLLSTILILLLLSGTGFSGDAENKFAAAKGFYDNKQFEAARAGFASYLQLYPTAAQGDEAKFWLAESCVYLGQYPAAESYYNQLVNLNNNLATAAAFRLCDIPYLQGQFDVAKPRLEAFVDKYPRDKNLEFVLYYLGEIAMRSGGQDSAEAAEFYFAQCDRMFPEANKTTEIKFGLAWAKNKLGKQTEANALYQQLLTSTTPAVAEQAAVEWGKALFDRGDYNTAITTLLEFQRKYPNSKFYAGSQRVLARSRMALNDFNGALSVFSQISPSTADDKLQKVRCLYALDRKTEAQTMLNDAELTSGAAYKDEIALLKSVFLYDAKDYKGMIALLENLLTPQYDAVNNKMMFNYTMLSQTSGVKKLNDEAFFKACSLLALAYAKNGDTAKAQASLAEMRGQATLLGGDKLNAICTETANQLAGLSGQGLGNGRYGNKGQNQWAQLNPNTNTGLSQLTPNPALNPNWQGGSNRNPNGFGNNTDSSRFGNHQNQGQWTPNYSSGNQNNNVITTGTDLDRFWRALQLYEQKNYTSAAAQLEQILSGQYNQTAIPKQYLIFYNVTGANGTLDEMTFAKACTTLALTKAQLGDTEQANAILTALTPRIKLTDDIQKRLLQEAYSQLAGVVSSGNAGGITAGLNVSALSDAEQRRFIREANAFYNTKRFGEADTKLSELLNQNPSEGNLAEALLLLAKTKYKLGQDTAGVSILERIATEFTSSAQYADALWYLGLYYDSCGDSVKAVEYFQILADKFPNSKNIDGALYFLALDDLTNGNGRKANSYLLRVYRNNQNGLYWSHAVWTLAYEAFKKKEFAQADIYLQKVLQHPPDTAILDRVLYLKGELAMRQNKYETAFLAFRDVSKLCPDSPLSNYAVKNAQVAAGKTVIK